jgi:hypothetical protein
MGIRVLAGRSFEPTSVVAVVQPPTSVVAAVRNNFGVPT